MARATAPSTMSSITNAQTSSVPTKNQPRGKKITALATAPTVPTTVMTSGVSPARASREPIGTIAREIAARAWMFSIVAHDIGRRIGRSPLLRLSAPSAWVSNA